MDETTARAAAASSTVLRSGIALGDAHELAEGWYFRLRVPESMVGCKGIIVNKRTAKLFHLGSAFPVERDLALYDQGYQFESYDLVVRAVRDRAETLSTLERLRVSVVEPEEADGVVWKIPRQLTRAELSRQLDALPCTFANVKLYFVVEALERARHAAWFTFELREHIAGS